MTKDLDKKLVVITGASSRLGKATALAFSQRGAHVVLASYKIALLDELVENCQQLGGQAEAIMTNATDISSVKILATSAARIGQGRIDCWVNIAEAGDPGNFLELPIEVHDEFIRANFLAYIYAAHQVLPYFKRQQKGILINHVSGSIALPISESIIHNSIKSALEGFSLSLRKEMEDFPNISICDVYSLFPGPTNKNIFTANQQEISPQQFLIAKSVAENIVNLGVTPQDHLYLNTYKTVS